MRLEARNVSFRYPGQGGEPVLKNISFTAEPCSTVAILGSTGSGKSSLISLIPRLYDTTEGDVLVDGRSVRDYTLDNLRGGVTLPDYNDHRMIMLGMVAASVAEKPVTVTGVEALNKSWPEFINVYKPLGGSAE